MALNDEENDSKHNRINEDFHDYIKIKNPYGKNEGKIVFFLSLIISVALLIAIGLLQFDEYDSYLKQRNSYLLYTGILCYAVDIGGFDIITTPLAVIIIIIFIILYKRRSLCIKRCGWKNFGLPMIVSVWNKTDRTYTSFVYGRIAFEVFRIVEGLIAKRPNAFKITLPEGVHDPTDLFKLLMRILEVIFIGIRYYPTLVAFRAKACSIYLLASFYMWIDMADTVYQQGKCESIADNAYTFEYAISSVPYWITYKVLTVVPTIFFSTYVTINLTYRAIITLANKARKKKNVEKRKKCMFCSIDDDTENIYSHSDILYVLKLFRNRAEDKHSNEFKANVEVFTKVFQRFSNTREKSEIKVLTTMVDENQIIITKSQRFKNKMKYLFKTYIYDWQDTFRFTSRFINTHIVAFLTLYHLAMLFLFYLIDNIVFISNNLSSIDFDNLQNVTFGDISCLIGEDFCIPELNYPLPLPKAVIKFGREFFPSLRSVLLVPFFCALLICTIQVLIGIRDSKRHLLELYKGKCVYLPPIKSLSNASISASSFHYGGYLTGYLIWGFILQYLVILIFGILVIILRATIGDRIFWKIFLKLVPTICVIIVKQIVNFVTARIIFLKRDSKILAVDNFRAFNVFLYFNFFFDCFLGFISAIIRLIKSSIAAIIMMPRIAYSFMGRHLERMDNGYSAYMGYLYMESSHTNPILITFCCLLSYRDLSEHLLAFSKSTKKKQSKEITQFIHGLEYSNRRLNCLTKLIGIKKYNKRIVNKWHLIAFLMKNPILLMFRNKKSTADLRINNLNDKSIEELATQDFHYF